VSVSTGRDQRMSGGADSFASQTCPSRYRNPEVVNVAEARFTTRPLTLKRRPGS
jgi:hypothetical protein